MNLAPTTNLRDKQTVYPEPVQRGEPGPEEPCGAQETGSPVPPLAGRGGVASRRARLSVWLDRACAGVGALVWNMAARPLWAVQRLQLLLASGTVSQSR